MKKVLPLLTLLALFAWLAMSCDDQIYPELPSSDPILVIDAWVNTMRGPQKVDVYFTQPYFDSSTYEGVSGAEVYILVNNIVRHDFIESENGRYIWLPVVGDSLGNIGNTYNLRVEHGGVTYQSFSVLNPVPLVDSVTFKHQSDNFISETDNYVAEFWSTDLVGSGDFYWIKAYKNGLFLNKPSEINIAIDAGFSKDEQNDGVSFIQPIQDGINPLDESEEEEGVYYSPYSDGDSVYVEIHSIDEAAYNFLNQIITQTDRPGGFAEFFAKPLSNIQTNISSSDGTQVLGYFCVSSVAGNGARLDTLLVPKEE